MPVRQCAGYGSGRRTGRRCADGPRAGSDDTFLRADACAEASGLYLLQPGNTARDVLFLTKRGYRQRIQPVDMFPFTNHIDIVLLTRQKTNAAWPTSRSRQRAVVGGLAFLY